MKKKTIVIIGKFCRCIDSSPCPIKPGWSCNQINMGTGCSVDYIKDMGYKTIDLSVALEESRAPKPTP